MNQQKLNSNIPTSSSCSPSSQICLGKIVGAQGLKGEVRIKTYSEEPSSLTAYGELFNNAQQPVKVKIIQIKSSNLVIASVKGCTDRNQAQALVGTKLYINREQLASSGEEEYYYHDIIGMTVLDDQENLVGKVKDVENYGAGDFLEIVDEQEKIYTLPFNKDAVSVVDIPNRKMYIQRHLLLF
jgi:16S rRNA processing protein RimM